MYIYKYNKKQYQKCASLCLWAAPQSPYRPCWAALITPALSNYNWLETHWQSQNGTS